ncbi:MAG: peptidase C25 [Candidatus Thermoplasmatota archaeon]|nr:peptidase C25 [Candidatus Thermoplasmatota archaeon]
MKKWLSILFVGMFLISGFGATAITTMTTNNVHGTITERIELHPSSVEISEYSTEYVTVQLPDIPELYLLNPGQPMMPRMLKQYELPFGATDIHVQVTPRGIQEQMITQEIRPAPTPVSYTPQQILPTSFEKDLRVYDSDAFYPDAWSQYHVGCGLNANNEHVTHLVVNMFPVRYQPTTGRLHIAHTYDLQISYTPPDRSPFPLESTYDLVIISPSKFSEELDRLVTHKTDMGVPTVLKTTEDIYAEYTGVDEPEQIKYFIKDAMETWGVQYVLLFGGLKSIVFGRPKDDTNHGSKGWYVPVRYSNFAWDGDPYFNFTGDEPGFISDLYYGDVYKEGGVFDNWDSNGNGIFAEWAGPSLFDDLDLYPDVAFGRLACRNTLEAKHVIDKIITYEAQAADPSWFNRIIAISGDGFLDQEDWGIQWNTTGLPTGEYTIHAQCSNPDGELGPVDEIQVTLDTTQETNITFNHDDHLNPAIQDGYPAPPIAEIVSISNNNILGNTDRTYTPHDGEAYCNDLYWWANISYVGGVLTIRGKTYDPSPYGNLTNLSVWITNEANVTVFSDTRENMETYYEGEWVVGEKNLLGRGGALYYISDDFEKNSVFTSNGKWVDQSDVIREFSEGYGLAYFSGHGSPGWWGDHYPGIPGNRRYGQVAGLVVSQVSIYFPFIHFPVLPMRKLSNIDKLPVVCVGGCHNSMFSVSLIPSVLDAFLPMHMFTYGAPTPECWGWYMVKLPRTGAIATMGNTGYGWGSEGDVCTIGTGDGWLNTEFFRQYGVENHTVLGVTYTQAITSYIDYHKVFEYTYWRYDHGWDGIDQKTVQQWQLLGDPSLQIGGYA